ncbi:MAG: hypothetical protein GC164_02280 [Phycisphaera sp.]|nr:hypothetical protein [Phycisphaera sp.]
MSDHTHVSFSSRRVCSLVAAAVVALLVQTTAQAITYDFKLAPGSTPIEMYDPGLVIASEGITMTASAYPRFLYQDENGLGVTGGFIAPGDDPEIDNDPFGFSEGINFTFSEKIRLESITFTQIGNDLSGDWAQVKVGAATIYMNQLPNGNATDTGVYTLDLNPLPFDGREGTVVNISAFNWVPGSDFQVSAITVTKAPHMPLPSPLGAGLALLSCLGGVHMMRRPNRLTPTLD